MAKPLHEISCCLSRGEPLDSGLRIANVVMLYNFNFEGMQWPSMGVMTYRDESTGCLVKSSQSRQSNYTHKSNMISESISVYDSFLSNGSLTSEQSFAPGSHFISYF